MNVPLLFQKPNQIVIYFMLRASTDWRPATCWKWSASGVGSDWLSIFGGLRCVPSFCILSAQDFAGRPR